MILFYVWFSYFDELTDTITFLRDYHKTENNNLYDKLELK